MSIDTKFIGKTYPSYTYEVGKEKIKEYARAIKNLDPHYHDDDFGKKSKYGTIIAPPTFAVVYGGLMIGPVFGDKELNLNMAMLVHGEQVHNHHLGLVGTVLNGKLHSRIMRSRDLASKSIKNQTQFLDLVK